MVKLSDKSECGRTSLSGSDKSRSWWIIRSDSRELARFGHRTRSFCIRQVRLYRVGSYLEEMATAGARWQPRLVR
jgi:hypothetical protein